MSRVIKFRAWAKRSRLMELITSLYWFEENGVHDSGGIGSNDDYELMQFTGLHDVNGAEIYEGDIVSMWYAPQATCKGVISFDEGCFMFDTKEAKPMRATAHQCGNEYKNSFTVIGNIYEHPHLLDGSK